MIHLYNYDYIYIRVNDKLISQLFIIRLWKTPLYPSWSPPMNAQSRRAS